MKRLASLLVLAGALVLSAPAEAKQTYAEKKLGSACTTTKTVRGLTAVCKRGRVTQLRRGSAKRPSLMIKRFKKGVLVQHMDSFTRRARKAPRAQAAHNCSDDRGTLLWTGNDYVLQGFASDVVVYWANEEQLDNFDLVNGGNFASGGNFANVWVDLTSGMRDWMGLRHPTSFNTPACTWSQGGDLSGATDNNTGRVGLLYWGDNGPDSRASLLPYCAIGGNPTTHLSEPNGRNEISAGQYHSGCPYSGRTAGSAVYVISGRPVESDFSFNLWPDWCSESGGWCSQASPYRHSVRQIARHELGHGLGIDHTCVDRTPPTYNDPPCSNNAMDSDNGCVPGATCWPDYIGKGDRRVEQALYP